MEAMLMRLVWAAAGHTPLVCTRKMCEIITHVILQHTRSPNWQSDVFLLQGNEDLVPQEEYGVEDTNLPPIDEAELRHMKEAVRKLHVNFGHPSIRALMSLLKNRGVDPRIVNLAREHRCESCQEVHLPVPHKKVSAHDCQTLWHTLQMDIFQLPVGEEILHCVLFVDEASRFATVHELFRHHREQSRNCSAEEAIRALEQSWVQMHGLPNVLRCDTEGAFRSTALAEWAEARGVDLQPCAAEDHGQIGIVEALIQKMKQDARTLLRTETCDPFQGILQVVAAHNHLDRVGGYAPSQWAYGRLPSLDGRLFQGGNDLPVHASEGTLGTDMRANLVLRVKAEEIYRRSQAMMKISRALNSQPRRYQVFLPGDLVYYRRYKTPRSQGPSHAALDQPKMGIARWYGPGRVIATETRSEYEPYSRKPGSIVWIVAAGRLKRCSPQQLRHCSEHEKILAESTEAVTMPWSFNSLMHLVERGQFERYDDVVEEERNPVQRDRRDRLGPVRGRSRSRARAGSEPLSKEVKKTPTRPHQDPEPAGQGQLQSTGERRPMNPEGAPEGVGKRPRVGEPVTTDLPAPAQSPASSSHGGPLFSHPPFQEAQQRSRNLENRDIPDMTLSELLNRDNLFNVEEATNTDDAWVFQIEISLPEKRKDLKSFQKDAQGWISSKMRKGAELKWGQIPAARIPDFQKAKAKELGNWTPGKGSEAGGRTCPAGPRGQDAVDLYHQGRRQRQSEDCPHRLEDLRTLTWERSLQPRRLCQEGREGFS